MMSRVALPLILAPVFLAFVASPLRAVPPKTDEYALILEDPPLAKDGGRLSVRSTMMSGKQEALTQELTRRKLHVSGAVKVLLNAVFLQVPHGSRPDLTNLPNVKAAIRLLPLKRHLYTALGLVQVPGAWSNPRIGGESNAGAGIKIGIIDTGLDDLNPAFNDASLTVPTGYPKVSDPSFAGIYTNNKVIVSRSYAQDLSAPDSLDPVDYVGHGTAVAMIAAGGTIRGPAGSITGVAPKAYLGNYKIFGSPGVNDFATNLAFVRALEDAAADGMDVVTAAFGAQYVTNPSFAPLDSNTGCPAGIPPNIPNNTCDVIAFAVENAVENLGLTVVVSAGDDGQLGNVFPTLGTIDSPGTAPGAITVGATTNAHSFVSVLSASGAGVSSTLSSIDAQFGDTTKPTAAFSARLVDGNGDGCTALPANSLTGDIALVIRGNCNFDVKANNVAAAGGTGIVVYLDTPADAIFVPTLLADSYIPMALIGNSDGVALKSAADTTNVTLSMDPALFEASATADDVAGFSSRGPAIGLFGTATVFSVKPDLVAVGQDIYTATQVIDPSGNLYDPSGFTSASGTSFAVPLVAGAVALVKQANPTFTPGQLKSAVVNTATTANLLDNGSVPTVNAIGAGKLVASDAVNVAVTCEPANVHFGVLNGTQTPFQFNSAFTLTNVTGASIMLNLNVSQVTPDNAASVSVSPATVTIGAGSTASVTLSLAGNQPSAGTYEGQLNISGAGPTLHVPYQYLEADGNPTYIFPVLGDSATGAPGEGPFALVFRILDRSGVPVAVNPTWKTTFGNGGISQTPVPPDGSTDQYGVAGAYVNFGTQLGTNVFEADAGGLSWQFFLTSQNAPTVAGVGNAATFVPPIAPGSYMAIVGSDLATTAAPYLKTSFLPLSLATTTVTFTTSTFSVPAPLSYAAPGQINVQVPWELAGQSSAIMQVSVNNVFSAGQTVNLASYAPGIFEFADPASGQLIAAALDLNYRLVDSVNPIPRGQVLQIYANGLGPVTPAQFSGYVASTTSLTTTTVPATVTIGGQPVTPSFSGLSPGSVGLYQLNVTVPSNIPAGYQPVVVTINGVASQTSHVYVR